MRLIDRYILGMTLQGFLGALGIISGLLMIQRFYKIIELAVTRSLGVMEMGELVLWAFPMILFHALPVSILVGALLAAGRLTNESELCAMMAAGVGKFRIAVAPLLLGILAGIFAVINGLWLLPSAYIKFDDIGYGVGVDPMKALRAGTIERVGAARFGVRSIDHDRGTFDGFVALIPSSMVGGTAGGAKHLLLARSGIWVKVDDRLTLRLNEGTLTELPGVPERRMLRFGRYTLHLPLVRTRSPHPKRMHLGALLASDDPVHQGELLRRLLGALTAPLLVLVALPLAFPAGAAGGRRGGGRAILRDAVFIYLGTWILSFLGETLVEQYGAPSAFLALPQVVLAAASLVFWRRHA